MDGLLNHTNQMTSQNTQNKEILVSIARAGVIVIREVPRNTGFFKDIIYEYHLTTYADAYWMILE